MLFALTYQREPGVGSFDAVVDSAGRTLGLGIAAQVSIHIQCRFNLVNSITYPSHKPIIKSGMDITNEVEESFVVLGRPPSHISSKFTGGSQQIISGHTRAVKDAHEYTRSVGL